MLIPDQKPGGQHFNKSQTHTTRQGSQEIRAQTPSRSHNVTPQQEKSHSTRRPSRIGIPYPPQLHLPAGLHPSRGS